MLLQLADNTTLSCPTGYISLPSQGLKVREDYFDGMANGEFQTMLSDEGYKVKDIAQFCRNRAMRNGLSAKGKGIFGNKQVRQEKKQEKQTAKIQKKEAKQERKTLRVVGKSTAKQTKADAKLVKSQAKQTRADAKVIKAESGEPSGFDKIIESLPEVVTAGGAVVGNLVGGQVIPKTGNPVIDGAIDKWIGKGANTTDILPPDDAPKDSIAKISWFDKETKIFGKSFTNKTLTIAGTSLALIGGLAYNASRKR